MRRWTLRSSFVFLSLCAGGMLLPTSARPAPLELWPELHLTRVAPVAPVTTLTLRVGGVGATTSLDDRVGFAGRGSVGLAGAVTGDVSLGGDLWLAEGVRGTASSRAVGGGRLSGIWSDGPWRIAGGADFWVGNRGLVGWIGSASPWLAASWRRDAFGVGVSALWDRSERISDWIPLSRWSEASRPGLNPGLTIGWDPGPVQLGLSYTIRLDGERPAPVEDALALDLRYHWPFSIGSLTTGVFVRTAAGLRGAEPAWSSGALLRLAFDARGVRDELFPPSGTSGASDDDAAAFDPFGG